MKYTGCSVEQGERRGFSRATIDDVVVDCLFLSFN